MSNYHSKLYFFFAKLNPLSVEERVKFCEDYGLWYPWMHGELQRELHLKLD